MNLILDGRDQKFVLQELLHTEDLCRMPAWSDFSPDMFDMVLHEAERLAVEVIFPALVTGDREGCRLEDGQVFAPPSFRRCFDLYREGGWINMGVSQEAGGQGFPMVITMAAKEWFIHNFAFFCYPEPGQSAAHMIEVYGTEKQKRKYMDKMYAGIWGGTMALTEPSAGSDVGNIKTKAVRLADGTFRLQGTKIFITSGDHDLTENIVHPVLARIEGDPAGTSGISIFLVPKFLVNDDGSLGRRNDYAIGGIEHKMGLHGSSTCVMNFGDNGDCYAELLGEERQGMKIMFQMMNEARIAVGLQSVASASMAYLHALHYAKERLQGSSLLEMKNPEAPRVPIIQHADVRRMLLWMKAHVEGMRALLCYVSYCVDREHGMDAEADRDKYHGLLEVLTPLCKAYCSDMAFKVTELAIQTYGGYGFCSEYPVEQFMRDIKIASIYEGANGIQALDLVGRKMGLKKGMYFMSLLGEMNATIAKYQENAALKDLAGDVRQAANTLAETAMYFAESSKAGKFLIPVGNAYPFLMLMGKVVMAWLLFWEAGVAREKLDEIAAGKGIHPADMRNLNLLAKENADAAFYIGKVAAARYFIKHVLPEIDAVVKAVKSEDLSMIDIPEESFAV
ncbi:MAG TPA: acyl-CoA dehydrogenase [Smithellaceae bacterium]|nr:acyl-CoA dehydrogenase [Smithellaceae bacterium]HRV44248.1 acyl-CoA dehydrogenase [Smithellaceae bacterium]